MHINAHVNIHTERNRINKRIFRKEKYNLTTFKKYSLCDFLLLLFFFGQFIQLKLKSGGQNIATAFLLQATDCSLCLGIGQDSSIKERRAELQDKHFGNSRTAVQKEACHLLDHHPPLRFIQELCLDSKRGCRRQEDAARTVLDGTDGGGRFALSLWGFWDGFPTGLHPAKLSLPRDTFAGDSAMPRSHRFHARPVPLRGFSPHHPGVSVKKGVKQSSFQRMVCVGQSLAELSRLTHQLSVSCLCRRTRTHTHTRFQVAVEKYHKVFWKDYLDPSPSKSWYCVMMCARLLRTTASQVFVSLCSLHFPADVSEFSCSDAAHTIITFACAAITTRPALSYSIFSTRSNRRSQPIFT